MKRDTRNCPNDRPCPDGRLCACSVIVNRSTLPVLPCGCPLDSGCDGYHAMEAS